MEDKTPSTQTYTELLASIKERIQSAQVRAAVAVNQELVLLYWGIGKEILARQSAEGWGRNIIPRLAKDLAAQFTEMKGLSPRNLGYMKAFAEAWPEESILQQLVAKLPWGHNVRLLDHVKDPQERRWYAQAAIEKVVLQRIFWCRRQGTARIERGSGSRDGDSVRKRREKKWERHSH